jgi:hypothetical protein
VMMTRQPSLAKRCAEAKPIPVLPPVMIASLLMMFSFID